MSLIPIIIGIVFKKITNKSRNIVKIRIEQLRNGSSTFKCGNCGATDSFLIPFLGKNLFQCSDCGSYNILEDQVNMV